MSLRKETIGHCELWLGDCLEVLPQLSGIHACVCDPPYHLTSIVKRFGSKTAAPARVGETGAYSRASAGFMGQTWDGGDIAFRPETWALVAAALRPGAHLAAFSGTRTYHRMACAIEDAGFEIRDMLDWLYGTGFPKSHDVSKGIDRVAGVQRKVIGHAEIFGVTKANDGKAAFGDYAGEWDITAPASESAKQWAGWGTALKPAKEPIAFGRKPLSESSIAANVLAHGTGAINIDGCRLPADGEHQIKCASVIGLDSNRNGVCYGGGWGARTDASRRGEPSANSRYIGVTNLVLSPGPRGGDVLGRWPANLITDGSLEVYACFPEEARESIRFFYTAKASKEERELGLDGFAAVRRTDGRETEHHVPNLRTTERRNHHPTVKPVDLMQWLCRLVTAPGGTVLDPFMGSGSTGIACVREGFRFVGIEQSPDYFEIACRRIEAAVKDRESSLFREPIKAPEPVEAQATLFDQPELEPAQ